MDSWHRAINFDLIGEELEKHHPKHNRTSAYKELENFFTNKNFSHRQGSGYVSNRTLSFLEFAKIVKEMFDTFSWLEQCSKRIDATIILEETYNLKAYIGSIRNKEIDHNINIEEELLQTNIDEEIEL